MKNTIKATTTTASANDKIFAVFDDADNSAVGFYERLIKLGVITRAQAKPYAMAWASKKYDAPITAGQRGDKLPSDSAAEKAMNRVLSRCFENVPSDKVSKAKEPATYTALQNTTADKFINLFAGETKRQKMRAAQSMLTQLLREVK